MKELMEIAHFVSPKVLRQIAILGSDGQENSINKLYELSRAGEFLSDEELNDKIFKEKVPPTKLVQLKSKLKLRMINHLFLLDPNEALFKDFSNAFQNCRKMMFAAEILYTKGARISGINIAEKAFRMAEKFELIDICDACCQFLRNAYRVTGDKRKLRQCREKSDHYHQLFNVQREVKKMYFDLAEDLELFKEIDDSYMDYLEDLEEKITVLLRVNEGPFITAYGFSALCSIKSQQQDFQEVIRLSKEGIRRLSKYHFLPKIFILALYDGLLKAAISLGDFRVGQTIIAQSHSFMTQIKGINQVFLKENFILLAIRTGNYSEAIEIYQEVTQSNIFKKARALVKEAWELFGAYLFLLLKLERVEDSNQVLSGFRMGKFLNSADHLRRDKIGYNLSFLMLQVIYALFRKDYDEIFASIERLKAYKYKYLKKEESLRARYFVKMILTLPESDFHKAAVERKSKKWMDKMAQVKSASSVDAIKGEIIPYELQWDIINEMLTPKFSKRRNKRTV